MGAYETSIYHAILITAIVLGCVIVYFAVSVFRQQRKYIRLQRQYFTDEINLLEKDRTRIARDLHDEVGPLLSLTKSHIAELEGTDEKENVHIGKATEHLRFR
jgi:signal transduction histidine kinase